MLSWIDFNAEQINYFVSIFFILIRLIDSIPRKCLAPSNSRADFVSSIGKLENKNVSVVRGLNDMRRQKKATDMVELTWDQSLVWDAERDMENILSMAGCYDNLDDVTIRFNLCEFRGSWDCDSNDCGPDANYLRLLINQPGFHHIGWEFDPYSEELGTPMERLYWPLWMDDSLCGYYHEYYNETSAVCGPKHTYKMYSKSNRVGCALYECLQNGGSHRGLIFMRHFACHFKALKTFRVQVPIKCKPDCDCEVDEKHIRDRLFNPLYSDNEQSVCSQCPNGLPHCNEGLCSLASPVGKISWNLLLFLILIVLS